MTVYNWVNDNLSLVKQLEKAGVIKYKAPLYYAIYSRYSYYVARGNLKTPAIEQACMDFNTCRMTGFNAIKEMEKEL
jgi:hypothetical protein